MSKKLLAAGLLRDFEFGSMSELEEFLDSLAIRCYPYKVIETFERSDGTVLVRILSQFLNCDLIEL